MLVGRLVTLRIHRVERLAETALTCLRAAQSAARRVTAGTQLTPGQVREQCHAFGRGGDGDGVNVKPPLRQRYRCQQRQEREQLSARGRIAFDPVVRLLEHQTDWGHPAQQIVGSKSLASHGLF